jgi:hypothetical protein
VSQGYKKSNQQSKAVKDEKVRKHDISIEATINPLNFSYQT